MIDRSSRDLPIWKRSRPALRGALRKKVLAAHSSAEVTAILSNDGKQHLFRCGNASKSIVESFAPCHHANGRWSMSDDKTQRSPQDDSRIAMGEDYEVRYWTERFGITRERLCEAVDAVGHSADAVKRYLQG